MGRGLSDLQRRILRIAYRNYTEGNHAYCSVTLYDSLNERAFAHALDKAKEMASGLPVDGELQEYIAFTLADEQIKEIEQVETARLIERVRDTCTTLGLDPEPVIKRGRMMALVATYCVDLFEISTKQEADDLASQMRLDGFRANANGPKFGLDQESQLSAYQHELLAECFGFGDHYIDPPIRADGSRKWWAGLDRQAITEERYNSARASLSRAIKRLAERGLISIGTYGSRGYCNSKGFMLTPDGLEAARAITVNSHDDCNAC